MLRKEVCFQKRMRPNNNQEYISLCIPRVDVCVTTEYITDVFKKWNIGSIYRIKEIPLRKENNYKRIIIDILCCKTKDEVKNMKEMMEKHGSIKLVYEMPSFWKLSYTTEQTTQHTYIRSVNNTCNW